MYHTMHILTSCGIFDVITYFNIYMFWRHDELSILFDIIMHFYDIKVNVTENVKII